MLVTLILLMAANLASMQRLWQKKDIDYSTELNFDLTVFAVQVSAVLAIVAFLLPTPARQSGGVDLVDLRQPALGRGGDAGQPHVLRREQPQS